MKYISVIFLLIFSLSCSQKKNVENEKIAIVNDKIYGNKLIEDGFLKFANPTNQDSLKFNLIESFDIYNVENCKIIHVDAEELAEFSFDFFMPDLNKVLSKRDLKIEIKNADDYESSFDIFMNDEKIKLYTKSELQNNTFWDAASKNFFKRINQILEEKNIEEKFFLLYGGNDLMAILLTSKQFKIIAKKYENEKNEIPYLP